MSQTLPKDGRTYRVWSVVEDLILDRYNDLIEKGMRGSFYLLRDWLDQRRQRGELLDEEFDYFLEKQEYYRDDFWPRFERKHGLRRPEVRPPTIVIEGGIEYTEERIEDAWSRSRGFIFVEKSGMADELRPLSNHGWLIIAAKGESTRTFREKVATDDTDRPILALTDADYYGGGIAETLRGHSKRTEHLEHWRALEERVTEIGLTTEDAEHMELPRERDPTKSPDEWRTELNALVVLEERHGIESPLFAYTLVKMDQLGIPYCPLPIEDADAEIEGSLERALRTALSDSIERVVDSVMAEVESVDDVDVKGEGDLMDLRISHGEDGEIDLSSLNEELRGVAKNRFNRLVWWRQSRYEALVRGDAGEQHVETVERLLG